MKYNIITGYSTCVFYEVIEDWNSRKFFNALIFSLRIQNNRHGLNFLFPVLKQIVTKTHKNYEKIKMKYKFAMKVKVNEKINT